MQEQPNDSSDSARTATKPGPAVSGLPAAPAYGRGSVAEVLGAPIARLLEEKGVGEATALDLKIVAAAGEMLAKGAVSKRQVLSTGLSPICISVQ